MARAIVGYRKSVSYGNSPRSEYGARDFMVSPAERARFEAAERRKAEEIAAILMVEHEAGIEEIVIPDDLSSLAAEAEAAS